MLAHRWVIHVKNKIEDWPNAPAFCTRFLGYIHRDMRRRHTISSGFSYHYQYLGISSLKGPDAACNIIIGVVRVSKFGVSTDSRQFVLAFRLLAFSSQMMRSLHFRMSFVLRFALAHTRSRCTGAPTLSNIFRSRCLSCSDSIDTSPSVST